MQKVKRAVIILVALFVVACATSNTQIKQSGAEGSKGQATEQSQPQEKAFAWPKVDDALKEPDYFGKEGVSLFLISENFPIVLDMLRIPSAFVDTLKKLDDESLKKQLEMWDQEQPPNIKFRMYEDVQHVNVWMKRLIVLEILGMRATDTGRWARDELVKFYSENAGVSVPGIEFEPRKSIVMALARMQQKHAGDAARFYDVISQMPQAFATAYERLAISRFKAAASDGERVEILKKLASVQSKAGMAEHLYQTAMALMAYGASAEGKKYIVCSLCLKADSLCVAASNKAMDESIEIPARLSALAQARDYIASGTADPSDKKFMCDMITRAGWMMYDNNLSYLAEPVIDQNREACSEYAPFFALAAHVMLYNHGISNKTTSYLNAGMNVRPWDKRFLTASIYAHYIMSLPLLFSIPTGNQTMGPDWYFKSGPGKAMDEQLKELAKTDPSEAAFIRMMMEVLSLNVSSANSVQDMAKINSLAMEALDNVSTYPDTPLFARLAIILLSQRRTEDLAYLLKSGDGVPRSDSVALLALLPHMLKQIYSGKKLPTWYDEAVTMLEHSDPIRQKIRLYMNLIKALKDKKQANSIAAEFINDAGPDEEISEKQVPELAVLLFNARALLMLNKLPDPPVFGKKKVTWPLERYWLNPEIFPVQGVLDAISPFVRSRRGDIKKSIQALETYKKKLKGRSDQLLVAWWLAYLYKKSGSKQNYYINALSAYNIYKAYRHSMLVDSKRRVAITLFDTAFDFTVKTAPKQEDRIELLLDYYFRPHVLPIPPIGMNEFESVLKKLKKNTVVVPPTKKEQKASKVPAKKKDSNAKSKK